MVQREINQEELSELEKTPTGIQGLDHVTYGGLPAGRPTLVCGGPGCGKTVLGMEFLIRGALEYDQPGLFISFEESEEALLENLSSLTFPVRELVSQDKIRINQIFVDHLQVLQAGNFSLDGLLIQLEHGVKQTGAKRVVLDTLGKIFSVLADSAMLRREIARLFQWLRDQDLTAVVTAEEGRGSLSRYGFEEYVSDCVIVLDHRIKDQISKRRLRIVKYRGSNHVKDEIPFLIGERGLSVFPITTALLDHQVGRERVSTGVESLDEMFGGEGYYRGSTVLVTGKAGTGKSSLASAFAAAACERGERALYLAFEESPSQLMRNMESVGIKLAEKQTGGNLEIHAFRPSLRGLEEHLINISQLVETFQPTCVVMDPITGLVEIGSEREVKSMLTRTLDLLKSKGITLFFTALISGSGRPDETDARVSSLMDTWIGLDYEDEDHTRRRMIHIIKSRGMDHSAEKREFMITSEGLSVGDFEDDTPAPGFKLV